MYDTNNNGLCLSRLSEDCEANALENQESFHFNARHVMHVMSCTSCHARHVNDSYD